MSQGVDTVDQLGGYTVFDKIGHLVILLRDGKKMEVDERKLLTSDRPLNEILDELWAEKYPEA